jgi:hypothetical protein
VVVTAVILAVIVSTRSLWCSTGFSNVYHELLPTFTVATNLTRKKAVSESWEVDGRFPFFLLLPC